MTSRLASLWCSSISGFASAPVSISDIVLLGILAFSTVGVWPGRAPHGRWRWPGGGVPGMCPPAFEPWELSPPSSFLRESVSSLFL